MQLRTALRKWTLCVSAILLFAATYVIAAESGEAVIPLKELPAACKLAKSEFRPISQTDVQQAKTALLESLARLDERLTLDGQNGADWRKYLQWDALQKELSSDQQPDKVLLTDIYGHYAADEDGLELVWFLDVQRALFNYIATVDAVNNPKVRTSYEARLDKLADGLQAYIAKPTASNALVIGESVRWLQNTRQADALVHAIRAHFVHPNLLMEVSADIVGVGIAEKIDDVSDIRDCILGTDIEATAHTTGQTSVALAPDLNFGVFDTLFFGTTLSDSVGYHKPVMIYSSSTTDLAARKRLWIGADGLSSYPAASNAETSIQIHDIQSSKGRRLVERMAWKRAGKQLCRDREHRLAPRRIAAQPAHRRPGGRDA